MPTMDVSASHEPGAPGRFAGFAAGSRIRTPRGERFIDMLQPGDLVVAVRRGGFAAVRHVRPREVRPREQPRPWDFAPVRVCAHAFGWDRPCRDLLLSPDHALYVDGALFRAVDLLNGDTIAQQDLIAITYYQVELDQHDVMIADGMPAESFLAIGSGDSDGDLARRQWDSQACAPLVWRGPKLAATRRAVSAQAQRMGRGAVLETAGSAVAGLLQLQSASA